MVSSASGASSIIGRYAYAIYDEGGLLDANVAAYPPLGKNQFGVAVPNPQYAAALVGKNVLAFADLTQLPGISALSSTGNPSRQAQVINSLVGWRNYATAKPTSGTLAGANFNFGSSSLANFTAGMLANSNGFLRTSNTALYNGQTDRVFASRQELMRLFLNGIALPGAPSTAVSDRANLQNALQYLGTFSRSLNQPSFAPDLGRAKVQSVAAGGNDSYQSPPADDKINPALQSVRVSSTSWTRNDGSAPILGEPLLKKRFALNRLAWLSYKGPAAYNLGNAAVVQTITQLGGNAGNTQDPIYQFVAQGTDDGTNNTNIPKYFGLTWDNANKRWKYIHGIGGGSGRIMTLAEVAAANREPDFFELIKASINVGTLGKAYSYSSAVDATSPAGYQQQRDNSADGQVIQIGANIIDQFDCDGFPTRILYTDNSLFGGTPQEYRGVEDLPYIYRVREGKVTIQDSDPPQSSLPTVTLPYKSGGLAAILQEPEIWNPHGWIGGVNSTATDNVALRPTSLRIVAIANDPNSASSSPGVVSSATKFTAGFQTLAWSGTTYGGPIPSIMMGPALSAAWNEQTTEIDLQVPLNMQYLFREPTLLVKPGVPMNSGVAIGPKNLIQSDLSGDHLTSLWKSTQIVSNGGTDSRQYIGFLAGYGPVAWSATVPEDGIGAGNPMAATKDGVVEAVRAFLPTAVNGITYRMQYQDPSGNWLTYDEKYANYLAATDYGNGTNWSDRNKTFNTYNPSSSPPTADNIISTEVGETCFDPRTSRFGMQYIGTTGYRQDSNEQYMLPVRQNEMTVGWAATTTSSISAAVGQLAFASMRPDDDVGFLLSYSIPSAPGWYPGGGAGTVLPGMLSQNNPAESANPLNQDMVGIDPRSPKTSSGARLNQYFADADNVIRRSMGAYVPTDGTNSATPPILGKPSGLPMKVAFSYPATGGATANSEIYSRPIVLNRPFRSPADLGCVFSGTPWRNLDMSTPESGAATLMDVFCINDTDNTNGMVAGKVDLNTRQPAVLMAILGGSSSAAGSYTGAYKDEFNPTTATTAPTPAPNITTTDASNISAALVSRTTSSTTGKGPLTNISELAGRWNSSVAVSGVSGVNAIDGSKSYTGFSDADLGTALGQNSTSGPSEQRVSRFREASIRPLASVGQIRTWNVMIDLVAQTGRYPASAGNANNPLAAFLVEGEKRYWIHLAIDRMTGSVIDKQVEVVKE